MSAEELKTAGNEAYKNKEYEKAIEHYTEAIKLDPKSDNAALCYSNRSASYKMLKKWKEMESDARASVEIKPDFVRG